MDRQLLIGEFALPARLLSENSFVLDIGGEGRHLAAWNLNRRRTQSGGSGRGQEPIPRLILARTDAIPLADESVDLIVVERTPLRIAALQEIARVVKADGAVLLRHAITPAGDPHRVALGWLAGAAERRVFAHRGYQIQETIIRRGHRDAGRS